MTLEEIRVLLSSVSDTHVGDCLCLLQKVHSSGGFIAALIGLFIKHVLIVMVCQALGIGNKGRKKVTAFALEEKFIGSGDIETCTNNYYRIDTMIEL